MAYEPGAQLFMGRAFPDGEAGGMPPCISSRATLRHTDFLATKLVRHLVADDPSADAFRKIEGVLQRSRRAG